jgi:hypothetical protein
MSVEQWRCDVLEPEARSDEQNQDKRDMTLHPSASVAQAMRIADCGL